MINKKIMVIAAHPDDEILDYGGTIKIYFKGYKVRTLIMTRGISSRYLKSTKTTSKLQSKLNTMSILANKAYWGKDVNILILDNQFDKNSLLSLVKIIEKEINLFKPDIYSLL